MSVLHTTTTTTTTTTKNNDNNNSNSNNNNKKSSVNNLLITTSKEKVPGCLGAKSVTQTLRRELFINSRYSRRNIKQWQQQEQD